MTKLQTYDLGDQIVTDPTVLFLENSLGIEIPIALGLTISPKEALAGWHDTLRSHMIKYKSFTIEDDKITLVNRDDDSVWIFKPLTLELFYKIKDSLVSFDREFHSDDELRAYYANAHF